MIYLYVGTKEGILRNKVHVLLAGLQKKRPDSELFTITSENASVANLEELAASGGLFDPKHIVFIDHVFEGDSFEDQDVKKILPMMQSSESVFVVLESKLLTPIKKILVKHAEKTIEEDTTVKKKDEFNMFALSDALVTRDKIKLWSFYLEALENNKTPEEIHGMLFWQAKTMELARKAKNANEAGLKPFVYTKSLRAKAKYSDGEIEAMPWNLMELLHRSRLESEELSVAMERWVLSL